MTLVKRVKQECWGLQEVGFSFLMRLRELHLSCIHAMPSTVDRIQLPMNQEASHPHTTMYTVKLTNRYNSLPQPLLSLPPETPLKWCTHYTISAAPEVAVTTVPSGFTVTASPR
ncbi:hypothetical protein NDU88_006034 [Pleurodeles waltl]|uniref:Uncharacterized protein n=1 Tax=Pleurodeles waltl TaxID=8319 RepID=A0AAV7NWZ4_PLEWA|nr:hypothetical protein NDU88_006034 [Pleurodeles waltl]